MWGQWKGEEEEGDGGSHTCPWARGSGEERGREAKGEWRREEISSSPLLTNANVQVRARRRGRKRRG